MLHTPVLDGPSAWGFALCEFGIHASRSRKIAGLLSDFWSGLHASALSCVWIITIRLLGPALLATVSFRPSTIYFRTTIESWA